MKARTLRMLLPISVLTGAIGAQTVNDRANADDSAALAQVRAEYLAELGAFEACVEGAGLEVDLVPQENGVFHSLSYEIPPVSSLAEREELDLTRDRVHDGCYGPQLLETSTRLEEMVAPSEATLRDFAMECAAATGSAITASELDQIYVVPPADADLTRCIQERAAEDLKIKFGSK